MHHAQARSAASALDSEPTVAPASPARPISRRAMWAGRVIGGIAVAFLLFDAGIKLTGHPAAIEGTVGLGFAADLVVPLGLLELACLLLYSIPRTSVLGAVLWTAYLGGAVATHVRLEHPLASHVLFPVYVAALLWLSLWCRDRRVRALVA